MRKSEWVFVYNNEKYYISVVFIYIYIFLSGKLVPILKENWNAEDLNFNIHLSNLNLLRHELSGQPNIKNIIYNNKYINIEIVFILSLCQYCTKIKHETKNNHWSKALSCKNKLYNKWHGMIIFIFSTLLCYLALHKTSFWSSKWIYI